MKDGPKLLLRLFLHQALHIFSYIFVTSTVHRRNPTAVTAVSTDSAVTAMFTLV